MFLGVTPTILRPALSLAAAIDAFVWNPADAYSTSGTFSNGNKTVAEAPGSNYVSCRATAAIGVNLARVRIGRPGPSQLGLGLATLGAAFGGTNGMYGSPGTYFYAAYGGMWVNGQYITALPSAQAGDTIDVGLTGTTISWYKNGTLIYSTSRTGGETGPLYPCMTGFNMAATFQVAGEADVPVGTWNNNAQLKGSTVTLSNGSLTANAGSASGTSAGRTVMGGIFPKISARVFEVIVGPKISVSIGLCTNNHNPSVRLGGAGSSSESMAYASNGDVLLNGNAIVTGLPYSTGDAIMVCFDADTNGAGNFWLLKNGVLAYGTNPPSSKAGGISTPANKSFTFAGDLIGGDTALTVNCGQSPFVNPIPSGFVAWG